MTPSEEQFAEQFRKKTPGTLADAQTVANCESFMALKRTAEVTAAAAPKPKWTPERHAKRAVEAAAAAVALLLFACSAFGGVELKIAADLPPLRFPCELDGNWKLQLMVKTNIETPFELAGHSYTDSAPCRIYMLKATEIPEPAYPIEATVPLPAPSWFTLWADTEGQQTVLAWEPVAGAQKYLVFLSTQYHGADLQLIADTRETSYADPRVIPGLWYVVCAYEPSRSGAGWPMDNAMWNRLP